MVEFCQQCGNILVLRTRDKGIGTYVCRNCQKMTVLPVEKIEITEKIEPRNFDFGMIWRKVGVR